MSDDEDGGVVVNVKRERMCVNLDKRQYYTGTTRLNGPPKWVFKKLGEPDPDKNWMGSFTPIELMLRFPMAWPRPTVFQDELAGNLVTIARCVIFSIFKTVALH